MGAVSRSTASSFSSSDKYSRPRDPPWCLVSAESASSRQEERPLRSGVPLEGGFIRPRLVGCNLGRARLVSKPEPEVCVWHDVGRRGVFLLEPPRCLSPLPVSH